MEFKTEKRPKKNIEKYSKENLDIAYKFTEKAYNEFGTFVKAIVLFGSAAKDPQSKGDIDLLIVVDDLSVTLKPPIVQTYRIIVQKMISDISPRLHITTLKFTSFWDYVRSSDPVAINILRDGVALVDMGFFQPLQLLLSQGRIRPTAESIWSYFVRAPATIQNSKWHLLQAALDLYWAVIDAAHAALMRVGEIPPSPDHVADMMEEILVKRRLLEPKYATTMRNFYGLMKAITHRERKEVTGTEYVKYLADANEFVNRMKKIIEMREVPMPGKKAQWK